jgi:electron transport complex protein RnfG
MNYILRLAGILFLITAVAAGALAYTNQLTAAQIAAHVERAKQDALQAVMPDAISFVAQPGLLAEAQAKDSSLYAVVELYVAEGFQGAVGIACSVRVTGYGGPVELMAGISKAGRITGVKIISAAGETPGLGAKIKDPAFLRQFGDKDATKPLTLVKSPPTGPNDVQAIAAATISASAVLRAVNSAAALSRALASGGADRLAAQKLDGARALFPAADRAVADPQLVSELLAADPSLAGATDLYRLLSGETLVGIAVAGEGTGYDGKVTAVTGFDLQGKLVGIVVVDMPGETVGLGTRINEPAFTSQFAGKTAAQLTLVTRAPAAASEIQAVTSATASSRGAVQAANSAIKLYGKLPR